MSTVKARVKRLERGRSDVEQSVTEIWLVPRTDGVVNEGEKVLLWCLDSVLDI